MRALTHVFARPARLLALTTLAVLCLVVLFMQAPSLAAPAAISPASAAPAPTVQRQQTADEDIRDIRPPYHIPSGWLWLMWTGGGVALAAVAYGAWRWHRRGARVKLPYELALEQLEQARRLMQPEQARAFSIAVSEVVRGYIEKCFAVRAAHRTTNEFLRDLATRPDSPLVAHQPALSDFLGHCDLAKFARWILSVPQMEAMLQSAGCFIVATGKPVSRNSTANSVGTKPPQFTGAPIGTAALSSSRLGAAASATTTLNRQSL